MPRDYEMFLPGSQVKVAGYKILIFMNFTKINTRQKN